MNIKNKRKILSIVAICTLFVGCTRTQQIGTVISSSNTNLSEYTETNDGLTYNAIPNFDTKLYYLEDFENNFGELKDVKDLPIEERLVPDEYYTYELALSENTAIGIYPDYSDKNTIRKFMYTINLPNDLNSNTDERLKEIKNRDLKDVFTICDNAYEEKDSQKVKDVVLDMVENIEYNTESSNAKATMVMNDIRGIIIVSCEDNKFTGQKQLIIYMEGLSEDY